MQGRVNEEALFMRELRITTTLLLLVEYYYELCLRFLCETHRERERDSAGVWREL